MGVVGENFSDFELRPLGKIIKQAKVKKCGDSDYPVLSMTMHDGLVYQNEKFKKTIASSDTSQYKVVNRNQLVISFPIDEGVLATQRITDAGIVSPAYGIWDIDMNQVDPEFLEFSLRCERAIQYYKSKLRGSTARRRSLPTPTLLEFSVPVPNMEQQKVILNKIHLVQQLIEQRKEQVELLDTLIKARFVEMFGDPVHNELGLPTKKLADLGSLDRGRSKHRPRNALELLNGPYPLIQTGEVSSAGLYITEYQNTYSELGLQQSKMWKAGTLCITIAANIAQTAILKFDACFPDSVVGFIPNKDITSIYMHYWFGFFQKILEEQAPQVAQKNINLKILSELEVIVPTMEQQEAFISFVEATDKSKLIEEKYYHGYKN